MFHTHTHTPPPMGAGASSAQLTPEHMARFEEAEKELSFLRVEQLDIQDRLKRLENFPPLPVWVNMTAPPKPSVTAAPANSSPAKS